jgi:hypothetical protein
MSEPKFGLTQFIKYGGFPPVPETDMAPEGLVQVPVIDIK